jgi:hypothetical protein
MKYMIKNKPMFMKRTLSLMGGLAFGLSTGVGAMYTVNEGFSIYGELHAINLSYAPLRGRVTRATLNGANVLMGMSTSEKEIDFVETQIEITRGPTNNSEPSKIMRQRLPFSSLGLNIGVNFRF